MVSFDQHDSNNSPHPRRAGSGIGVADRWVLQLMMVPGLLILCTLPSMAQERSVQSRRSSVSEASTSPSGVEQIRDPKLRSVLQSNGVLKGPASSSRDRAASKTVSSEGLSPSRPIASHSESPVGPASAPIRRASYEEQILAIRGEVRSSEGTESGVEHALAASETNDSKVLTMSTPNLPSTNVTEALQKTRDAKPKAAFLDLTGQSAKTSPGSEKPIGEHGVELSIESSPQQVMYRAVAWLVIALCLFSLAALGVRKWQRQRGLLPTHGGSSRVLETLSLGPGRAVSLIEMAGHRALVAFDAGGIKQLVLAPRSFDEELESVNEDNAASLLVSSERNV